MAANQDNMTCRVCMGVYRSPRFLPCHHTFCLPCLEELAKRHGNVITCPTCRAHATLPPGGVRHLQVNVYFKEEVPKRARSEGSHTMCRVHTTERVIFYCTQCEQAICMRCKLNKHEGHVTEDLSKTVARCKKTIKKQLQSFVDVIGQGINKLESCKQNEKRAKEKRAAVKEQIQVRYEIIVAMAGKYRDEALQELQRTSDDLEEYLAVDTQRVEDEVNSLLHLQDRAQHALSSACDTEVLQVEKEMRRRGSSEMLQRKYDISLYRPVLHGDFNNYTVGYDMKTFIGSPVEQSFPSKKPVDIVQMARCGEGGCREVHAVRQQEDGSIDVYYGGTGGDYSKEKGFSFIDGCRGRDTEYGIRISCVTRTDKIWRWSDPSSCNLGSKNKSMHSLFQNFKTGVFYIGSMKLKRTAGVETYSTDILIRPKVYRAHNFDTNKQGTFFAVVDEDEDENSNDESVKTNKNKAGSGRSRVVRLYSNKSDDPIATYRRKNFFPTDVCFFGKDLLLIADWMNDCVHVTKISVLGFTFISYLSGSGDMVRPTALNLDLNGQVLIGCGNGWVLRSPVDF